jgi:hypothetical protein
LVRRVSLPGEFAGWVTLPGEFACRVSLLAG